MSTELYAFPSFLHPPLGETFTILPVTRNGVRFVPDGDLVGTETMAFAELRIRNKQTQAESRGICGLIPATAFLDGTISPHEKTLLARLQRQETTVLADGGALGKPVLLTVPSLKALWADVDRRYELIGKSLHFKGSDNDYELRDLTARPDESSLEHHSPRVNLSGLSPLVIADGHHRAETHALLSKQGEKAFDFIPVCIIGGDELTIGAFTRVVTDARAPSVLLPKLSLFFEHRQVPGPTAPTKAGEWLLVCRDAFYQLTRKAGGDKSIDSEWFDHNVLPQVFNINDTRADERIIFEPTPDPKDGMLEFPREEGKVYLCGFPLPVDSFFNVVEAGHCLPPKSTRFEPRVPSGLVVWQP